MPFHAIAAALAAHFALPRLPACGDGACHLTVNGIALRLAPQDEGAATDLSLRAHLGSLGPTPSKEHLAGLLAGNLFTESVDGQVLCMDMAANVFLVRHLDRGHLDLPQLLAAIQRLVHHAEHWRKGWPRLPDPTPPLRRQAHHHVP